MSPIVVPLPSSGSPPNSSLQIGRLLIGVPLTWTEQMGDPVTGVGGAVVAAARTPPQFQVGIGTIAADGQTDTLAARLTIRRQLRSLFNNSPVKLGAFLYVLYSDDPEQNGWYVPDQATLTDYSGSSGLATGFWQIQSGNWYPAGRIRTHREARAVWSKDLRTGLYPRDTQGWIYTTDFSALPALALAVLPNGAASPARTVSGQVVSTMALPAGRDGGVCQQAVGLADLTVVGYDRPESAMNLSDVIVYDRRGQITAPTSGPDTSWVEVYGPDWPWNWLTAAQPNDMPVLDNGLVRVRYDASAGDPGFRVEVWTGSAYLEQGKVTVERLGDSTGYCNTWVSASLVEWTPERAVLLVVLANNGDANSRERIYVTVQRGTIGATFECYPAVKAAGTTADAQLTWTPAQADTNDSLFKVDSQTQPPPAGAGQIAATAGSGSSLFGATTALGAATFSASENYVALLRYSAVATITAYQHNLAVVQAAVGATYNGTDTSGYGAARNNVRIVGTGGLGYVSVDLSFAATQAQQAMDAHNMTLGTGTSSTADANASDGTSTTATRTTDANAHVTQATWPNSFLGQLRLWARVKVSTGTGSFYAKTGATTGATVTTTSASYVWVDLGEITANGTTLELHAWLSVAGTVSVDRVEAVLTTDRARTNAIYSGARDNGQAALTDQRMLGAVVAR